MEKLKVCLILDSRMRRFQSKDEIKNILTNFDVTLVLIDKSSTNKEKIKHSLLEKVLLFMERIFSGKWTALISFGDYLASKLKEEDARILSKVKYYAKRVDIFKEISLLRKAKKVYFEPKKVDKFRYDFEEKTIDLINEKCNVVVLEGFTKILTGKILKAPKYGVISGHGADIRRYRGRPHGFFQWINNEHYVGASVQRLTEDLDGGYLLICDHTKITDAKSWLEVKLKLLELRGDLLARALKKIENGEDSSDILGKGKLTRTKDADRFMNTIRCLKKDIIKRYFA